MEESSPPAPAATIASVACMSCRRLKMKCVGSENPPCARCAKAGRPCVVAQRGQPPTTFNSTPETESRRSQTQPDQPSTRAVTSHQYEASSFQPVNGVSFGRQNQIARFGASVATTFFPADSTPPKKSQVVMPSIFTTSPYSTVVGRPDLANADASSPAQRAPKRQKIGSNGCFPKEPGSSGGTFEDPLPERDMLQFIDIFRKRMMSFIPLLDAGDLDDASEVISRKKPLAHCICYVTARYVPGGEPARSRLFPTITAILQSRAFLPKSAEEEWTMLQALSVLYAYRVAVSARSTTDTSLEISQRSIKSHIETYALHLAVHRSISGVKASIRAGNSLIKETIDFRKYVFWLWLFNMSHHHSVVTGTPPSIREDSTIRAAPELLGSLDIGPRIIQILAEVELCLLWGKASINATGLGEWWCPLDVSDEPVDYVELGVLGNVDALLKSWFHKWSKFFTSEPLGPGIDFHYRFTRFCLSSYLIRTLRLVGTDLRPSQKDVLNRSVADAANFCRFFQELGPANRDSARYTADFGFVMLSFSCLFIIQACETFHSEITGLFEHLSNVEEVAQLMKELAINASHGPSFQSRNIMAKLHHVYEELPPESREVGMPGSQSVLQHFLFGVGQDEIFTMDPEWDLMDFFPEFPQA